jgi:serine/threonine-protein kinase
VLDQDPIKGTEVEKGSTITLTVAKAAEKATVPDVAGKTCDEAVAQMQANDLTGTCTDVETDDQNLVGKVIATTPGAGSSVDKKSTVTIQIGKAKENQQTQVPQVQGQALKDAKKAIQAAGLQVGNVAGPGDDKAIVLTTNPGPGTPVAKGSRVDLVTAGQPGGNNGGNDGGVFGGITGGD